MREPISLCFAWTRARRSLRKRLALSLLAWVNWCWQWAALLWATYLPAPESSHALGSAWRSWRGGQMDSLIRPDVELYVGQSGSALVNEGRRVLGINSTALARNAVITVPAATIDRVVDAILERGHVPRPYLGAAMQAVPVPEALRSHFGEGVDEALLVLHVEANAPAATAGILVGDLVLSVDGKLVDNVHGVQRQLSSLKVGDTVAVVVIRGGVKIDLKVILADRG